MSTMLIGRLTSQTTNRPTRSVAMFTMRWPAYRGNARRWAGDSLCAGRLQGIRWCGLWTALLTHRWGMMPIADPLWNILPPWIGLLHLRGQRVSSGLYDPRWERPMSSSTQWVIPGGWSMPKPEPGAAYRYSPYGGLVREGYFNEAGEEIGQSLLASSFGFAGGIREMRIPAWSGFRTVGTRRRLSRWNRTDPSSF